MSDYRTREERLETVLNNYRKVMRGLKELYKTDRVKFNSIWEEDIYATMSRIETTPENVIGHKAGDGFITQFPGKST